MKFFKKKIKPLEKMTQIKAIKKHLETKGSITSKEAFEKYGCTRLSGMIYRLRYEYNMKIETLDYEVKDRYGRTTVIAKYIYRRKK